MSQVYSTEPPTSGRVVLRTSHGPLDVSLWCSECPAACRLFLQLCADGYYDGTVFHRIMDGFLIQAGKLRCKDGGSLEGASAGADAGEMAGYLRLCDGEDTGAVGDGAGAGRAKLELSARVRFNHRGQVAMALPLDQISRSTSEAELAELRPQFFVTLDEAPFLDGKHVIFGTVSGPTVFNALRIGKVEADAETGMPLDVDVSPPPRIEGVKIDHHTFGDLVPTDEARLPWKKAGGFKDGVAKGKGGKSGGEPSDVKKRRKKRKGKRDLNVLSFGDEERELGDVGSRESLEKKGAGMVSSHDFGGEGSKFLSSSVDETVKKAAEALTSDDNEGPKKKKKGRIRARGDNGINIGIKAENKPKKESYHRTVEAGKKGEADCEKEEIHSGIGSGNREPLTADKSQGLLPRKKLSESLPAPAPTAIPKVSEVEERRAKYLRRGGRGTKASIPGVASSSAASSSSMAASKREEDVLARLSSFRGRVLRVKAEGKAGAGALVLNGGDAAGNGDDDLAARMAARHDRSRREKADAEEAGRKADAALTYRGQVLEEDSPDEDDGSGEGAGWGGGGWMKTKFRCRRHIDHASKEGGNRVGGASGGDGRDVNDYEVIDEKRGRSGGVGGGSRMREEGRDGRGRNSGRDGHSRGRRGESYHRRGGGSHRGSSRQKHEHHRQSDERRDYDLGHHGNDSGSRAGHRKF